MNETAHTPWAEAKAKLATELAIADRPDLSIEPMPNCAVRVTHLPSGASVVANRALSYRVNRDIGFSRFRPPNSNKEDKR